MSTSKNIYLNEFVRQLIINSSTSKELQTQSAQISEKIEIEPVEPRSIQIQTAKPVIKTTRQVQEPEKSTIYNLLDIINQEKNVEKIECPGPDKQFLVLKIGSIESVPFSLSKEEIDRIIQDTAIQTNTKINEGLLVTEIEGWSFVGIISEFGGSRFMIESKV